MDLKDEKWSVIFTSQSDRWVALRMILMLVLRFSAFSLCHCYYIILVFLPPGYQSRKLG